MLIYIGVTMLAIFFGTAEAQEVFKWVDENGRLHFSDNLHSVPEKYRSQVKGRYMPVQRAPVQDGQSSGDRLAPSERRFIVPFERDGNHIIVDVVVNGRDATKMIVDTGATVTMIPRARARQLGIDLSRSDPVLVSGVGGPSVLPMADIEVIAVGGAEVRNLQAILGDLGGKGLLGMDFLSDFRLEIDNAKRQLVLEIQPGQFEGRSLHWWQQKFRFYHAYRNYIDRIRTTSKSKAVVGRAEEILRFINSRLSDLDNRASDAGVPREMRE